MWNRAHHRDSVTDLILAHSICLTGPRCFRYPAWKDPERLLIWVALSLVQHKSGNRHLQRREPRNTSTAQARWLRQDEPHRDHLEIAKYVTH